MQRYSYSCRHEVPIYDCDLFCRLRPSAMLRYIQSAAGEHLDALGFTHSRLYEEGFVFLIAGTVLKVFCTPVFGENIIISTAPLAGRGANMLRETVLHDTNDTLLAECQTNWAVVDSRTGRLLRASDFPHSLPILNGEWTPFSDPSKIRISISDMTKETLHTVRLSDLDQNLHMNNTVYADILLDGFADDYIASGGIDTLFLRYHLQARLHDSIKLQYGRSNQLFAVNSQLGEKKCFEGAFSLKPLETV